jgi:hypothetical protein
VGAIYLLIFGLEYEEKRLEEVIAVTVGIILKCILKK